jgi:hypothetical protein
MTFLKGFGMTVLVILAVIGAGAIFFFVTCLAMLRGPLH